MDLLPATSSLFWKSVRLGTFQDWPYQSSKDVCSPERMAAAGFFSIRTDDEPDLVECFICSKQLDGWEPTDDPWKEHKDHQPSCAFVKLQKQDECLWTVYELFELIKVYNIKEMEGALKSAKEKIMEEAAKHAEEVPLLFKGLRKNKRGGN
ncbi:hypothetical protein KPH14_011909 [Odynerus spinipes]|uniref:Baculoviral IAP repeat-containing protein 5 n=1 Tax=Odynerus spinipes TaxID=1348599 RepID=A0AAD9RAV1_9HYME|nr:hypothetical protein KPH14_011909 [Odynerus spinipes]